MSMPAVPGANPVLRATSGDSRQWQQTVELLRNGIVRISHAASGVDEQLDRRLSKLRKSVRNGADFNSLEQLISEVSRAVIAMDTKQSARHKESISSAENLLKALDELQPSWQVQRRRKSMAAMLRSQSPDLAGFLRDYSEMLVRALSEYDPRGSAERGLLGRFLNKKSGSAPALDPGADPAWEKIRQNLMRLLDHVAGGGELEKLAKRQRDRLSAPLDPQQLPEIVESAADLAETAATMEKRRFEEFASKLAAQIADLQQVVGSCAQVEGAGEDNRGNFERELMERTAAIKRHIGKSSNISELQRAVTLEVDGMTHSLETFQEAEALRHKKFEASIGLLQGRLGEAQAECNDLYSEISRLRQKSQLDSLTGLPNRAAFMLRAQVEYERATRYGNPLAMAVVDIDHFKRVNDSFGHRAGDTVIAEVGSLITRSLRKSDFVCRYGGEEFVMLLPETNLQKAYKAAEKVRDAVSKCPFAFRERRVEVTVSIGVAELESNQSISDLVEKADVALYEAKSAGRNRSMFSKTH